MAELGEATTTLVAAPTSTAATLTTTAAPSTTVATTNPVPSTTTQDLTARDAEVEALVKELEYRLVAALYDGDEAALAGCGRTPFPRQAQLSYQGFCIAE